MFFLFLTYFTLYNRLWEYKEILCCKKNSLKYRFCSNSKESLNQKIIITWTWSVFVHFSLFSQLEIFCFLHTKHFPDLSASFHFQYQYLPHNHLLHRNCPNFQSFSSASIPSLCFTMQLHHCLKVKIYLCISTTQEFLISFRIKFK